MFLKAAWAGCLRQTKAAVAAIDPALPVRAAMIIAAERIAAFQMSDFGQQMFRIVVGEGQQFPGLCQQSYKTGPGLVHSRLVHHLRRYMAQGRLKIDDVDLAAKQLIQLCKAGVQERLLFGMAATMTQAAVSRSVHGAVDIFMVRHALKV